METIFWVAFGFIFVTILVGIYILGRMCWELYKADMDFDTTIELDDEDV
jgi:hypothetical protein